MDVQTKPPRGYIKSQSVDMKYGRRWLRRGEEKLPALYSRIGEQLRNPKLHRTICRWVIGAPNWKKLITEQYRKRWPMYRGLRVGLFAEFALKPFASRTFFETAHTLPFFGVGGRFWRGAEGKDHYGNFFSLKNIDFTVRPWKGEARGDMYMNGVRVRSDVAPLSKSVGKWNFEPPVGAVRLHYRPPFPDRSTPYSS
jgi:hypothetical protein